MERIIKFRAWIDNETMVTYNTMPKESMPLYINLNGGLSYDDYGIKYPADDVILMQYTGLKDKNGIEIYEGDIVRIENYQNYGDRTTSIFWWKRYATFACKELQTNFMGQLWGHAGLEHILRWPCEVIGNIHEHKHLLNE